MMSSTPARDGRASRRRTWVTAAGPGTSSFTSTYHHDHLGSVRQVTDWQGQEVSRHRYYPFDQEATPTSSADPVHEHTGHERDPGFQV